MREKEELGLVENTLCVVDGGEVVGRRRWDTVDQLWGFFIGVFQETGHCEGLILVEGSGSMLVPKLACPTWVNSPFFPQHCFPFSSCNLGTMGPSPWGPPWRLVKRDWWKANQKILNPSLKGILSSPGSSLL